MAWSLRIGVERGQEAGGAGLAFSWVVSHPKAWFSSARLLTLIS